MEQDFTVLENKKIGRTLYNFRKVRDKKAAEVAEYIGIGEAAYSKYERGESKITIDVIQKVAECLQVDPLTLISAGTGHYFEIGNNSTVEAGIIGSNNHYTHADENLTSLITTLIQNQIAMTEKLMAFLDKK